MIKVFHIHKMIKLVKIVLKRGDKKVYRGEFDQISLYAYM
jgi:hypothetical protein